MTSSRKFIPMNIAVLTVSDSRSTTDDKSGDLLEKRILSGGHNIPKRTIVPDEQAEIVKVLRSWVDNKSIDVILSTGGTGLTGRDVTVEAHKQVYEKEIEVDHGGDPNPESDRNKVAKCATGREGKGKGKG